MLDLEGVKYPKRIELEFDNKRPYQFALEGSTDGDNWCMLLDYRQNQEEICTIHALLDPNASRYVKIVFTALPPGVAANLTSFGLFGMNQE